MRVSILSDIPILSGPSFKKIQIFIIKSFILVLHVITLPWEMRKESKC